MAKPIGNPFVQTFLFLTRLWWTVVQGVLAVHEYLLNRQRRRDAWRAFHDRVENGNLPGLALLWGWFQQRGTELARFPAAGAEGETEAGFYYSPPTLINNYIYIGTARKWYLEPEDDNFFYRLDASLNKVWEFPLGIKELRGGAVMDRDRNIYFVVEEGRHGQDTSGSTLWLYSITNPSSGMAVLRADNFSPPLPFPIFLTDSVPDIGMISPAIAPNPNDPSEDIIYVGGTTLRAFRPNGQPAGSQQPGTGSFTLFMNSPAIDPQGNIYFCADGQVYCFSPPSPVYMDKLWSTSFSYPPGVKPHVMSSPAFSSDYSMVIVAVRSRLYWYDASTGVQLASFTPSDVTQESHEFRASVVVDDNDHVYIGTKSSPGAADDDLFALYLDNNNEVHMKWRITIGADIYSTAALGSNRVLYLGSEYSQNQGMPWHDRRVHAFSMETGAHLWSRNASADNIDGDITWSSPAISDTGVLYISTITGGGQNGAVLAYKTNSSGLLPGAAWPRFHGGNANSGVRGV